MNWEKIVQGNNSFYHANIPSGESLDCMDVWRELFSTILPSVNAELWDSLACEIWIDTGRLVFFPFKGSVDQRVDELDCILYWKDLLAYYEEVDSRSGNDEEFDNAIRQKVVDVAAVLSESLLELREDLLLSNAFRKGFSVVFFSSSDIELGRIQI